MTDIEIEPVIETPATRLREAAEYIRYHWRTGTLCDERGMVCAVGAILGLRERAQNVEMSLLLLDPIADKAVTLVADHLQAINSRFRRAYVEEGLRVSLVEMWNDDCVNDGDEVAEVFEKVAARWEESGNA